MGPLVSLLRDGSAGGKEQAAGALTNVACDSNERRDAVVSAGALGPLVSLLRDGSAVGKEQAAGALRNVAAGSNERRDAVIAAGGQAAL